MITAKLFVFLSAAFLLAIAPGPGMLYVMARSLAGGKLEGALSALGTFVGGMVHVFAAAAGISVILARSAAAFAAVKYAGAAYLCFLGIRMILEAHREAGQRNNEASTYPTLPRRGPLWQGVTTEVLNPKTALFFLSFIPQFVDKQNGHIFLQFLILGSVSVVMNTATPGQYTGNIDITSGNPLVTTFHIPVSGSVTADSSDRAWLRAL